MPKKKKRLQMQKDKKQAQKQEIMEEAFVRDALAEAVQFGLMDQVGYDEHGEPLYMMKSDVEERLVTLKNALGLSTPNFSE